MDRIEWAIGAVAIIALALGFVGGHAAGAGNVPEPCVSALGTADRTMEQMLTGIIAVAQNDVEAARDAGRKSGELLADYGMYRDECLGEGN